MSPLWWVTVVTLSYLGRSAGTVCLSCRNPGVWHALYGVNGKVPVSPSPNAGSVQQRRPSPGPWEIWILLGAFFHGDPGQTESSCRTLSQWVVPWCYMRAREAQWAASGHQPVFLFIGLGPVFVEDALWARTRRRTDGPPQAGRARPLPASNGEASSRQSVGR